MPEIETVAVVGGGILGISIAHEIVRRELDVRVIVLDRDQVGSGASRRSAGLHFPRGSSARIRALAGQSQDAWEELARRWPEAPIHPVGMSLLTAEPGALSTSYLERAALQRLETVPDPAVRVPEGVSCWSVSGAHYADVGALTQMLASQLRDRVTIREGARVTDVNPVPGGVTMRLGTQETLTVDRLVIAPGPWLRDPAWHGLLGPLPARVKKVVALHLDRPVSSTDGASVFEDEDAFLLPLHARGHWLFSWTCLEWDVDPDTIGGELSRHHLADARELLGRYAPDLVGRISGGRVFADAYTTEDGPLVRSLDTQERIVFAGTAAGSGYRLAPAIAAEAVDLLRGPVRSGATKDSRKASFA